MTIQSTFPGELQLQMKRPLPNLLARGFQLGLRNWPCVLWAYAVNLLFSLLGSVPFAAGLASPLDHSLAAQRIAGTLDAASLLELFVHFRDTPFAPMAFRAAGSLNLLQLLLLFIFFTGSVFIYVSAEPPRLSVLLRGGVAYFWRFVRAALVAICISVLVVGILLGLRAAMLARAGNVYVEARMFLFSAISLAVVLLVALLLRLWWDLVEVYIVRNAMDGERSVRRALLPALRLLGQYFFRTFGSFLVAGLAGVSALALCLALWKVLPAHQVWLAFLLAQVGLFLLLAGRFWQRGVEATLVMAADPPNIIREDIGTDEMETYEPEVVEEGRPSIARIGLSPGVSEPTLRDLVQKLRTQPWGNPDVPPGPLAPAEAVSAVESGLPIPLAPAKPAEVNDPSISLLDRHEDKFPLGGVSPDPEAASANSVEPPKVPDTHETTPTHEKTPHSEKKPLP
jgi:hypothetical protein